MGNTGLRVGVGHVTRIWRVEWIPEDNNESRNNNSNNNIDNTSITRKYEWCKMMAHAQGEHGDSKIYHYILIRHFENGKVEVFVDGDFETASTASFSSTTLQYNVGCRAATTRISFNEVVSFAYAFITTLSGINGEQISLKELNEQVLEANDPRAVVVNVTDGKVEAIQDAKSGSMVQVAVYTVKTALWDGTVLERKKRYSDFVQLDRRIRGAFQGSHMLTSVPYLPPKNIQMLSNHSQPAFIEKRRAALHTYLSKVVTLPRVTCNPFVLSFLGLLPDNTAQSSSLNTPSLNQSHSGYGNAEDEEEIVI